MIVWSGPGQGSGLGKNDGGKTGQASLSELRLLLQLAMLPAIEHIDAVVVATGRSASRCIEQHLERQSNSSPNAPAECGGAARTLSPGDAHDSRATARNGQKVRIFDPWSRPRVANNARCQVLPCETGRPVLCFSAVRREIETRTHAERCQPGSIPAPPHAAGGSRELTRHEER